MTAELVALPARGGNADDTVRAAVRALLAGREARVETVAPAVGMNVATLYRRLAGRGAQQAFRAGEVADLADYFDVKVADLYDGLGGLVGPGCPRQDSNLRPSDYMFGRARRHLRLVPCDPADLPDLAETEPDASPVRAVPMAA